MVLESIVGEKNIRRHPIFVFFLTILICFGSLIFADMLFPAHASVLSIAFITIALAPLIFNVLSDEEAEEAVCNKSSYTFFARHFNVIMLYVWIFVGVIVAFMLVYAAYPFFSSSMEAISAPFSFVFGFDSYKSCTSLNNCDSSKERLFEEQIKAFCVISGSGSCTQGVPISIAGRATSFGFDACMGKNSDVASCTLFIFENNAGVLLFTIVLSLLYGVGAIFIIAWNASIIGLFFGETFLAGNISKMLGMFQGMLLGHGPPELLGYVFGALAGAILSAMVARGKVFTHEGSIIIRDVLFLSGLAFFSVAYAAVTEAVGILGFGELYFLMGFVYLLIIITAVFLYGNTRASPRLSF